MLFTIFFIEIEGILYKLKSTLECLILEDLCILWTEVFFSPDQKSPTEFILGKITKKTTSLPMLKCK